MYLLDNCGLLFIYMKLIMDKSTKLAGLEDGDSYSTWVSSMIH